MVQDWKKNNILMVILILILVHNYIHLMRRRIAQKTWTTGYEIISKAIKDYASVDSEQLNSDDHVDKWGDVEKIQ